MLGTSVGASPRAAACLAVAMLLVGVTACHTPVRTESSHAHLSAVELAVACALYEQLRDVQGAAFEQRVDDRLAGRLDDC